MVASEPGLVWAWASERAVAREAMARAEVLGLELEQARVPVAQALASASVLALAPASAWEQVARATETGPGQELEWVPVSALALVADLDSTLVVVAAAGAVVQRIESFEPARRSDQFPRCGYW